MTPGWRIVRNFLSAFFARGSRPLLAGMSNEKMLQFEPSSWSQRVSGRDVEAIAKGSTCSLGSVVQSPDGLVDVDLVAEGVRKGRALGHGGGHGGLEEVHGCWGAQDSRRLRGEL